MSKRFHDQPPIGFRADGSFVAIKKGDPIPQPVIINDDGSEMTPEEAQAEFEGGSDNSELEELLDEVKAKRKELQAKAEAEE